MSNNILYKVNDFEVRTTHTPNEIHIYKDCAKVLIYDRKNKPINYFIIDVDDVKKIKNNKWRLWYTKTTPTILTGNDINFPITSLVKFLIDYDSSKYVIDHINCNRLDNRKSNLRLTTQSKNVFNKSFVSTNTSGKIGIYYDKSRDSYVAEIRFEGNRIRLRNHFNYNEAVYIRFLFENELFKEYRNTTNDDYIKDIISRLSNEEKIRVEDYFEYKRKNLNSNHFQKKYNPPTNIEVD